jgi:hypothetical protein
MEESYKEKPATQRLLNESTSSNSSDQVKIVLVRVLVMEVIMNMKIDQQT